MRETLSQRENKEISMGVVMLLKGNTIKPSKHTCNEIEIL